MGQSLSVSGSEEWPKPVAAAPTGPPSELEHASGGEARTSTGPSSHREPEPRRDPFDFSDADFVFPAPRPTELPPLRYAEMDHRWLSWLVAPIMLLISSFVLPFFLIASAAGALTIAVLEPRLRERGFVAGAMLAAAFVLNLVLEDRTLTTPGEFLLKSSALLVLGTLSIGFLLFADLLRRYGRRSWRTAGVAGEVVFGLSSAYWIWSVILAVLASLSLVLSTGIPA